MVFLIVVPPGIAEKKKEGGSCENISRVILKKPKLLFFPKFLLLFHLPKPCHMASPRCKEIWEGNILPSRLFKGEKQENKVAEYDCWASQSRVFCTL